ncbi:MAG: hypothetical protein WA947_03650 [Phormidesmis sp.]
MAINNPNDPNIDGVKGREATPEEIARRDGYVQGRTDENYVQGAVRGQERVNAQAAANDGAASGLIVGLTIALLAAGIGAAVYFLSSPEPTPVAAPEIEQTPQVQKEVVREKTIIERETPASAPAPDVNISVPETPTPDVNIINQEPAPAAEPAPASAPAPEPAPAAEQPATEAPADAAN